MLTVSAAAASDRLNPHPDRVVDIHLEVRLPVPVCSVSSCAQQGGHTISLSLDGLSAKASVEDRRARRGRLECAQRPVQVTSGGDELRGVAASDVYAFGSGERPASCVSAQLANAFFDATAVRIRSAPMSAADVRTVLRSAGIV